MTAPTTDGQPSDSHDSARAANTRRAYEALKERIAAGDVGPGAWLREYTLATSLGLSRTPVREALRLLAAEGVVELVHNRGARVVSWTAEDIDEAYRLRALIEGYGAGLAARHADQDCVTELRALQNRYERELDEHGLSDSAAQCNDDFHAAVMAASRSPRCRRWWPRCRAHHSSGVCCAAMTTTTGGAASWPTATSSPPSRTPTRSWPPRR